MCRVCVLQALHMCLDLLIEFTDSTNTSARKIRQPERQNNKKKAHNIQPHTQTLRVKYNGEEEEKCFGVHKSFGCSFFCVLAMVVQIAERIFQTFVTYSVIYSSL